MQRLNQNDLSWCLRRAPKNVLDLLKRYPRQSCIAGGFIRSCVAGEPINDIDIFAASPDLAKVMAEDLASDDIVIDDSRIHKTDNAYTIRGYRITPQIIHRWTFPDVMDVAGSFDFTIACAMIFYCDRLNRFEGFCDPSFYPDLAAKRLVYRSPIRNEEAGGSMLRVLKFYQRGYRIPLNSLGAVIARLTKNIESEGIEIFAHNEGVDRERALAKIITGLLVEVDPVIDPSHAAHLPSVSGMEI